MFQSASDRHAEAVPPPIGHRHDFRVSQRESAETVRCRIRAAVINHHDFKRDTSVTKHLSKALQGRCNAAFFVPGGHHQRQLHSSTPPIHSMIAAANRSYKPTIV